MFETAHLYKEELEKLKYKTWYDPKYMYYGPQNQLYLAEKAADATQLVWTENGGVKAFFSYRIDREARSVHDIGAINFGEPCPNFIKALLKHFKNLFDNNVVDRIEFFAFEDNPANKNYERIVKKLGGKQVGKLTNHMVLSDGKLHSSVFYEIFRQDYMNIRRGK